MQDGVIAAYVKGQAGWTACLSTGAANTPARRLYESIGFMIATKDLNYLKTD
jgi:hypothetical protein